MAGLLLSRLSGRLIETAPSATKQQ